ncbi:MAG TPA: hypothetical protein VE131_02885, partial [Terriglobales bacterium]|nr:hypothetical protein [Terriglobales bacterium]
MFVLGLFGLLSRPLMPATSVATESKKLTQSDARGHERVRVRIQPGESFAGLLVRHGLRPPSVKALIHTLRPFLNTRKLPVGQKVDLVIDTEADSVRALELVVSKRVVRANVTADGW